jgi:hypothetical protein
MIDLINIDEIRTMTAGPELDLAFAKAVGLVNYAPDFPKVYQDGNGKLYLKMEMSFGYAIPWHPSTSNGQALDFAATWLAERKWAWNLCRRELPLNEHWPEEFRFEAWLANVGITEKEVRVSGPSASIAIVRGVVLLANALAEKK